MMRKAMFLVLLNVLCVAVQARLSESRSDDVVSALAGRYSSHFKNGTMQGGVYWSDDVAEIVPVGTDAAYIRIGLDFANGHSCTIAGVGKIDGERILYDDRAAALPDEPPCRLSVSRKGNDLSIDDGDGSCKSYCGTRGSLTGQTLPFASRRPITYMQRLRASANYKDALEAWQSHDKR